MKEQKNKKDWQYTDPELKVVKLSGVPILADSTDCFFNSVE
jgi:hypothetical protein